VGHEATRIDKSVLTLSTPHRYRNKEHLRFVAQQPCLLCGRKPTDAHHIRFVQPRALGRKASDEFAVPLCRAHHRAVHRTGDEKAWWQQAGIDPIKAASFGNSPESTSRRLLPRRRRKMPLRSALQHPAGKARRHQRQPSERLATTNMLTAIGLCGELFHVASGHAHARRTYSMTGPDQAGSRRLRQRPRLGFSAIGDHQRDA
jgi:hypothetical protein